MSKYAEKNLRNGETIEIKAKFSFLCIILQTLWFILCLLIAISRIDAIQTEPKLITKYGGPYLEPIDKAENIYCEIEAAIFFLIGFIPFIKRLLILLTNNLVITNKRVLGKTGIISLKAVDYPIEKVDNVKVKASILGNIFRYATLTVNSANSNDKTNVAKFIGVSNANDFKNHLTEAVERHQAEARKAQAEEIAKAMGK